MLGEYISADAVDELTVAKATQCPQAADEKVSRSPVFPSRLAAPETASPPSAFRQALRMSVTTTRSAGSGQVLVGGELAVADAKQKRRGVVLRPRLNRFRE
jgi:hypothetical protein